MSENEWVVAGAYFQQKLYIHIFVTKKSTLKAFYMINSLINRNTSSQVIIKIQIQK